MKKRIYLCCIFLMLAGILLFLVNSKGLIYLPGLFLISILLMVAPTMYLVFDKKHSINKFQSLLLMLAPLSVVNYIYYIQMGVPVGFTDPHAHIFQYLQLFSDSGKILFENAQRISFNFVGLYLLFRSVSLITNLDIVILASIIPPLLNVIIVIIVYSVVSKLHGDRIALLAAMIYGWSYEVIVYGQEFRTQTIGVLLLFTITLIILVSFYKKGPSSIVALIILLMGITTSSFVVICNAVLLLGVFLITISIINKINEEQIYSFTFGLFIIFIVFIFFYLLYIGTSLDNIAISVQKMFLDAFTKVESPALRTGNVIYGTFSKIMIRIFWLASLFSYIYYFINITRNKDKKITMFFMGYSILLAFFFLNNLIGPLSAGRILTIALLMISTVVAYSFHWLSIKKKLIIPITSLAICIILANAVKLPNYIAGEKTPLRPICQIDYFTYWHIDYGQYLASDYLLLVPSSKTIYTYSYINRYPLLINAHNNNLTLENSIDIEVDNLNYDNEDYILLENKFNNVTFMGREKLPKLSVLNSFCNIYSNNDYLIYKACHKHN